MFDESDFLELIGGGRKGIAASLCRTALAFAELPYSAVIDCRNAAYDRGSKTIHRVSVPVISVGNLTAGGTGKTPMVRWIAQWFRDRGVRVVIVSRGYGAEEGSKNDEALELERQLPDVPHLQNPDRVAAATTAIEEFESQVVVLDDAFQHRRIHRELDLVLIDALRPFGFGHLLPRGLLREPLRSLRRAATIAISRANLVSERELTDIVSTIRSSAPDASLCQVTHQPVEWSQASGKKRPLRALAKQRVAAFCGIGNPAGFRSTLESCDVQLVGFRTFPDHHGFAHEDLASLAEWAAEVRAESVICTAKDLVKIRIDQLGRCPLYALDIGIRFSTGESALTDQLIRILEQDVIAAPR